MLKNIEDENMSKYLQSLTPTETSNYSLWKATKNVQKQTNHNSAIKMANGQWAKNDADIANTFATHLSSVFTPYPRSTFITTNEECLIVNSVFQPPIFPSIVKTNKKGVGNFIKKN